VCGRFNSLASGADFAKTFDATLIGEELVPNFNVAPTAEVYALISKQLERSNFLELSIFNWGLVPSWAKDKTKSAGMINARSETLTEKPSFKNLIARHRCVIPMQGFYEWSVISSGSSKPTKQAHYVSRADGEVMTVAGLWSTWIDPNRKQIDSTPPSILRTCTLITTDANDSLRPIHHRMPVILEKDAVAQWLDPVDMAPLGLLLPAENDVVVYEATTRLDRTRNVHSTQLIDDQSGRLF
jgi:putative SOS response-associated peptidase YedK